MCIWIFHDWREIESWHHELYWDDDFAGVETCIIGSECRQCGRRKIKKVGGGDFYPFAAIAAPGPYREALAWMKEERIK